jgi:hypothetical protein
MKNIRNKDTALVIITGTYIILSILAVWFLWGEDFYLTLVLFALSIIEMLAVKSRKVIFMFFLCGFGGAAFESIAIYFGAWHYSRPALGNIPLWLIPGWGSAGIAIITFYKLLSEFNCFRKKT